MIERLETIENKYNEINQELMNPEVLSDINKTLKLNKELSDLKEPYDAYQLLKKIDNDIEADKMVIDDPELGEMVKDEIKELEVKKEKLLKDIEIMLLPKDPNDGKNVVIEIRGAAGGDEANIFAGDLYRMYTNEEPGEAGGYSQIEFLVKGENVYSKLKYESGAHRVQRVPATETQGRVHTSTATVYVMPEAEDFDFKLDMSEIRVDITRSSGCGGQGVNTTDSAVRLTHIPTGTIVYSQTERSQIKNKEKAIKIMQTRLYDLKLKEKEEAEGVERRDKIGTGDRSEKIRTYNYPQNRVTDHRIGFTTKQLDRVMEGAMDEIIDALITEDQNRKLRGEEN